MDILPRWLFSSTFLFFTYLSGYHPIFTALHCQFCITGIYKKISKSWFSLPQTWGKTRNCVPQKAMAFHLLFSSFALPFRLWFQMDSCLQSLFPNGLLLAVTPMEQEAQVGPLNLCLQVPHSADHCVPCPNCSFLSPSLSIWKLLGTQKGSATLDSLSPTGAYSTQFLLSSSSNKKRWREEWRGLNICQSKEKGVQPWRGVAFSDNCWEAGFWGTGRRWDTVSSKVVCEEVQRQLIEQSLTSEKLYLNIYVTLLQIILFCLGFLLSYEKMSGHNGLHTSHHGQQSRQY